MSPTDSWLCSVVVKSPDWESAGCEFKYSKGMFSSLKEKSSLISQILNTKSEKREWNE